MRKQCPQQWKSWVRKWPIPLIQSDSHAEISRNVVPMRANRKDERSVISYLQRVAHSWIDKMTQYPQYTTLFQKLQATRFSTPAVAPKMMIQANFLNDRWLSILLTHLQSTNSLTTWNSPNSLTYSPKLSDTHITRCPKILTAVSTTIDGSSPTASTSSTNKKTTSAAWRRLGTRCLRALFLPWMYSTISIMGSGLNDRSSQRSVSSPKIWKNAATKIYRFSSGYSLSFEPLLSLCSIFFLSIIKYYKDGKQILRISRYLHQFHEPSVLLLELLLHRCDRSLEGL